MRAPRLINFKIVRALLIARNVGYLRDRASLMWSFVVPPFLIACLALAFSKDDPSIFKVGYLATPGAAAEAPPPASLPEALGADYVDLVRYDDPDQGLNRIRHHQLDMLVEPGAALKYWINPASSRGRAVEALVTGTAGDTMERVPVEGRRVRYVDWVVPGILGMNLMFSSLFGVGYVIVRYRKNGVLKRLKATPVTPLEFLTSQLLSRFLIMLVVSVTVYTAAKLALNLLMLGSYRDLILIAVTGNLALISIALMVAARISSEEVANGVLNLITLPMLLLSEVWFSLDGVPAWMQRLSQALPLTHMVQAARKVMVEGAGLGEIAHHLGLLAAMAVIFTAVAASIFRWS